MSLWAAPPAPAGALSPSVSFAAALPGAVSPSGLPLLHSLPGAPAAVYLDFGGYGNNAPYDTDGDPSSFGPAEQADIQEAWRHVASYCSMFDLDVTTEHPGSGTPFSYSLITNSLASGYNLGSFPAVEPTNFNAAAHARTRQSALAHEIGHSFGLFHQSVFDWRGTKIAEYSEGHDRLHGSIMGSDSAREVSKWTFGHPASSPVAVQDDVAVIAAKVAAYAGGDGFRPDDVPNNIPQARELAQGVSPSASGIIERLADADAYSFISGGGQVTIDVMPPRPSMLDAKLEVYAADGTLVAASDGPENDQHLAFPALSAGTYYAVVKSHGDYADLGPYDLTVREGPASAPPPTYNSLPAPTGIRVAPVGAVVFWDRVPGATGYAVERSADGINWSTAGTLNDPAAGTFSDSAAAGGRRSFYRVCALDDAGRSAPSAAVSLVPTPDTPAGLTVWPWRTDRLVLNWRDVSGESGYQVQRYVSGRESWHVVAQLGANVTSFTDQTSLPNTRYAYRVFAGDGRAFSAAAEAVGGTPLPALGGLTATTTGPRQISLRWSAIANAEGYIVERSTAGGGFASIAEVTDPRFEDTSVQPAKKYTYRVVAYNTWYQTATSEPVTTFTPAEGELPAPWQVASIGSGVSAGSAGYDAATDTFQALDGWPGLYQQGFRFIYRPLVGDGSITARLATLSPTPEAAMAGVMVAANLAPGASTFFLGVAQWGNIAWRQFTPNEVGQDFGADILLRAPYWLRIVRAGNTVDAYTSTGGVTWKWLCGYSGPLPPTVYAGLAVSAGYGFNESGPVVSDMAVATFDNVAVGNSPPSFLAPATVLYSPVTTTSASVSARGRDEEPEDRLTYTWSASARPPGASPPRFANNGTNAARTTTAVFDRAGRYVLDVRVTDRQGLSATSSVAVDVIPKLSNVAVSPQGRPVHAGGTLQLSAQGLDQFGDPLGAADARQVSLTWSADGGSVDGDGLFTAPSSAGWYTVTASATAPAAGGSTASATAPVSVYVYDESEGPTLLAAWSRKTHGRRGPFDLPLTLYGGRDTIEPRAGGPTTLRFQFSAPVVAADGTLDASEFSIFNGTFRAATLSGPVLTLDLAGIKDRQLVIASLQGLIDGAGRPLAGDVDVWVWSRYGDVTADGAVDAADVLALRHRLGRPATAGYFLLDLDLDGVITSADLLLVRRQYGGTLVE